MIKYLVQIFIIKIFILQIKYLKQIFVCIPLYDIYNIYKRYLWKYYVKNNIM